MTTSKKYLKNFGNKLKKARTEKNLKQEELAMMIGKRQCQIGSYECGLTRPSDKIAKDIADKLGIKDVWKFKYDDSEIEIAEKEHGIDVSIIHLYNSDTCTKLESNKFNQLNNQYKQIVNELINEMYLRSKNK